jgi:hypothetical protein
LRLPFSGLCLEIEQLQKIMAVVTACARFVWIHYDPLGRSRSFYDFEVASTGSSPSFLNLTPS